MKALAKRVQRAARKLRPFAQRMSCVHPRLAPRLAGFICGWRRGWAGFIRGLLRGCGIRRKGPYFQAGWRGVALDRRGPLS